jgi:DNA repair protein RadC
LEFLLHFAVPYKDNTDLAHALVDRFGTFAKTINADYNDLITVEGIDKHTASLFCIFRSLSQVYLEKKASNELSEFFTVERLKNYCSSLFVNAKDEEIHCLCFTDDLRLISSERVCSGSTKEVKIPVKRVVQSVFTNNCNRLAIAHNHPAGSCLPSILDVRATKEIHELLKKMDVDLVDHIVVGKNGVASMKECNYMSDY